MTHVPIQTEPKEKAGKRSTRAEEPAAETAVVKPGLHPVQLLREWLQAAPFAWRFARHPFRWYRPLYVPDFEVKETADAFVFTADVPGLGSDQIDVKLSQNRLTVSGHREQEKSKKGETFYAYERSYGSFSRSFVLPEGADLEHIDAELRDGVLTITVGKLPGHEAKQVPVNASS